MATVERPALVEVQRGQVMISTTLTPAQLERYSKVDDYDPERGTDPAMATSAARRARVWRRLPSSTARAR